MVSAPRHGSRSWSATDVSGKKAKKHTGCHVRLSVHDKSTNTIGATAVEAEGLAPFAVTYVERSLQCIGHLDVTNKSDGAHSAGTKKKKATGQAEIRSAPEESHPRNPRAMDTLSLQSRHDPKCQGKS